jgi:hypothetical protein
MVYEIVAVGNTVILEKLSYQAWQKQYGRSVGLRAPAISATLAASSPMNVLLGSMVHVW